MTTWLFAYGSLVSPASLARTIGRTLELGHELIAADVDGWGRRWNYGSATQRGDWVRDDGVAVFGGLVVSLGVEAAGDESVNGAIFAVDDAELAELDWRERAYDRTDVTDRVRLLDASTTLPDAPIAMYVPRPSAVHRYEMHRDAGTAAVRRDYLSLVEAAFGILGDGHLERFRTTPPADVGVHDVRLETRNP